MDVLELLAHPVRLRIVHVMRGGRTFTTAQLCVRLPDVSKAMVYRHVEQLVGGGVLFVAGERRVRGAVEREYRLRDERAVIDEGMLESLSVDDYRRGFAAAVAILVAEFNAYLDRPGVEPTEDLVGFRQHSVWLDRDELVSFIEELRAVILPRLRHGPGEDRARYLLSPILFPVEAPAEDDGS